VGGVVWGQVPAFLTLNECQQWPLMTIVWTSIWSEVCGGWRGG